MEAVLDRFAVLQRALQHHLRCDTHVGRALQVDEAARDGRWRIQEHQASWTAATSPRRVRQVQRQVGAERGPHQVELGGRSQLQEGWRVLIQHPARLGLESKGGAAEGETAMPQAIDPSPLQRELPQPFIACSIAHDAVRNDEGGHAAPWRRLSQAHERGLRAGSVIADQLVDYVDAAHADAAHVLIGVCSCGNVRRDRCGARKVERNRCWQRTTRDLT
eukprot:2038828-Prymnesium_polylepis.2